MTRLQLAKRAECDFAILGAGAIGSILGAHLARDGHSVVMLARQRRAREITTNGLRITGLVDLAVQVPALTDPSQLRRATTLIVAMKTPGTAEALSALGDANIGAALSVQNGILKDELLADAFGVARVLGAVADTSGEMRPGGEVLFTRNVNILIGEPTGQLSTRAQHVASEIDASGVRATAVRNIQHLEWTKFVAWASLMPLSISMRAASWRVLTDPGCARVLVRLVRELALLASALDIELTDESTLPIATLCRCSEEDAIGEVIKIGRVFQQAAPQHRISALQDLEAGRPLEVHETLGFALQKAATYQVPMPLVDAFYHLISSIDRAGSPRGR